MDKEETIKRKVQKETTITITYYNWKRLQLIKIHGGFEKIDNVISYLINKEEAKK